MRFLWYIALIVGCALPARAQQAYLLKMTDAVTGRLLTPVAVTLIGSGRTFYSGDNGVAYVPGKPGELISLAFVGFQTLTTTLPAAPAGSPLELRLRPLVRELQEVTIRPGKYTPYQRDSIERRETFQRALARVHEGGVTSPVTFIAERLSHRSRQIFAFQKQFNYWEGQRFIDSRYTPELVGAMTSLQGDSLAYFMNAYPVPIDYARAATDLELKMWIRNNYREWLKHPVMQAISDTLTRK